jgi:hypothetical protein
MDGGVGIADTGSGSSGVSGTGRDASAGASDALSKVFQDIKNALHRTSADSGVHIGHKGDHYISGDVHWDGYDLPTLIGMVASPADPNQVDTVAGLWRSNGAQITQGAENLSQSLTTMLKYWRGSAADQASAAITNTANWISAVGETAGRMADSVEDAGGALRSAQSTMPSLAAGPLPVGGFNPAAGGAAAATAGGPMGAASGALLGGLSSVFASSAANTAQKQQAVQTMQRYEQAAVTIDTGTPQFATPVAWSGGTDPTGVAAGGPLATTMTMTTSASGGGLDVGGQRTVPSFADNATGRWNALTAGGKVGMSGMSGTGGGGGSLLGGVFGTAGLGGAGRDESQQKAAATSGAVTNETSGGMVARGGSAGSAVLEDVGGRATPGAPGAPGMAAPGARGGYAQGEHRRRIPFEQEPFTTGLKAAPPVIGLNAVD